MTSLGKFPRLIAVFLLGWATASGQDTPAAAAQPAATPPTIGEAWNSLLQGTIPTTKIDPALTQPQVPAMRGAAGDFVNHFSFETRTEYERENTYFRDHATPTGVIDVEPTGEFNPDGIPYPDAFQPNSDRIYSFIDFGTRGWGSDRVNTHFSFRYRQPLTHVTDASPQLTVLNTFGSNRLVEMTAGYVEINGRATDGWFAGSSLQLGRINIYGAQLASLDGAAYTVNRGNYTVTLFGGRRYTFFSDPVQRAVGGANFQYRFGHSNFEYSSIYYIKGEHDFVFRHRFGSQWLVATSFRMIGGAAVDLGADALWTPGEGEDTTVRFKFAQKLSDKDYFYDYTINARDVDPNNPLLRLYLGPQSPSSDFVVDARRTLNSHLRVGGAVWVRHLNDSEEQGPYDTSFQDYRAEAQVYPGAKIGTFFNYRLHNSDRSAPFPSDSFFDVSIAGETRIQDMSAEISRSFGRLDLRFGGFYRLMNFQDRFFIIQNAADRGLIGNATVHVDQRTRLYFDYSLDTDFFVFRPSIRNSQILRVGLAWKY